MGTRIFCIFLLALQYAVQQCRSQMVKCDMPADVVFLLDASASIESTEWEQEKDFVGILIDSLAVEPHAINVGIIVYSTEIGQVVDLQPFKTRSQLQALLAGLRQTNQTPWQWMGRELCSGRMRPADEAFFVSAMKCTDTALAISRMRQMMQNQARSGTQRIGVVITDGRSDNVTSTIQQAIYARQLDKITMIALGVGNEIFVEELEEIARSELYPDQKRLFQVTDFAQLQGVVNELRNLICEVVPVSTSPPTTVSTVRTTLPSLKPISCPRPAEIVFLLDGSHSIKDDDWARNLVFISTLINSLEVDIDAIHVGIIVYSSNIGDTIPLSPFLDKTRLLDRVSQLQQPPLGRTHTALGLQTLRQMFKDNSRDGVARIGIVITDGKSTGVSYLQTIEEARLAKEQEGVTMFVVGVGRDTMQVELEAMATSQATLFNVLDFAALINIAEALRDRICIAIESTPNPISSTTTPATTPSIPGLCQECLTEGGVGYNTHPDDCTKYVACYPNGKGGYRAVTKDCPFGLFWSKDAVSCLDAAYVSCPSDPCRGQPEGWGHTEGTTGCGQYWTCRRARSVPHCCPAGHRYRPLMGCVRDASCQDQCSLSWTLAASAACPYRPNPADAFSFLEVVPGQGHVTYPCRPGTAYDHKQCACVYAPSYIGCKASLHYLFDGTFDDQSPHHHPARVERVLVTPSGTAYFNRTGRIEVNTLPADSFDDKFVLRIRYRLQPDQPQEFQWNEHYQWGFQDYFSTQGNTGKSNMTFTGGQIPQPGPDPALPSGQQTSTLEQIRILYNGTVIHPETGTNTGTWPGQDMSGSFTTKVYLGGAGNLTEPGVIGGVVYVPSNKGYILVLSPATSSTTPPRWQVVSKDGTVVESGAGEVPGEITSQYSFKLRPAAITSWFIIHTPSGGILRNGTGIIPQATKNLYAGLGAQAKVLTVSQIGDETVEWTISNPDGTETNRGSGQLPIDVLQKLKVGDLLKPAEGGVRRWAILSSGGEVLDSGTGDIPPDVLNKHKRLSSGFVLGLGPSSWRLGRVDGATLVEGAGTPPDSVSSFFQGSLVAPSVSKVSSWSVLLPNGTKLSGEGRVPDHIKALFQQGAGQTGSSTQEQRRWYVTDGSGTIVDSGFGPVPQDTVDTQGSFPTSKMTIVQQKRTWEVRDKDGKVVASGQGDPPADLFQTFQSKKSSASGTSPISMGRSGVVLSGANFPGYTFNQNDARRQSQPEGPVVTAQRKWSVTMPDGSKRSGTGDIPADIQRLMDSLGQGDGQHSWTVTMPDGTQKSGSGQVPAVIQGLVESQGGLVQTQSDWSFPMLDDSRGMGLGGVPSKIQTPDNTQGGPAGVQTQHMWTVTMPDGSQRSGVGQIPAYLQSALNAQRNNRVVQGERRWTVTMPDGTERSGTGDLPADLQALLNAQNSRVERTWSVRMPDGSTRSGTGEMPAELKASLSRLQPVGRGSTQTEWVRLPDGGSVGVHQGGSPTNRNALLSSLSDIKVADASPRARRAASTTEFQDLMGNCNANGAQPATFRVQAKDGHVKLTLRTTSRPQGTTLTLPATPGMNDVKFVYNGDTLKGYSNGYQIVAPLKGKLLPIDAPVTVGVCEKGAKPFRGEIDEVSLYACIP